jgi:hypothetical protein
MDGTSGVYGHGTWSLPTQNDDGTQTPGEWMPPTRPILCESGYHYCRDMSDLLAHLGPDIYEVEVRGEVDDGDDKACTSEARLLRRVWADTWTPESQRLFAVDCARQVARLTDNPELANACLDVTAANALYGDEWSAARYAARAAAERSAAAAAAAAAAVAWSAAADAAAAAPCDAAWDAAQRSAAAAWAAAADAAAAWAASARDAARDAAWDAAWDAQVTLIARYLAGEQGPLVEEGQ